MIGDRDYGPKAVVAVPALGQNLESLAADDGVMSDVRQIGDEQPFTDDQIALRGTVGYLVNLAHRDVVVELQGQYRLGVTGLHLIAERDVRDLQLLPHDDVVWIRDVVDNRDHLEQLTVTVEPLGQPP